MLETLADVVRSTRYKPGWRFTLDTTSGWGPVLLIEAQVWDSNPPHHPFRIKHVRPVEGKGPDGRAACQAWVLAKISEVERHETREWLSFGGERVFYPPHGDEGDPYA